MDRRTDSGQAMIDLIHVILFALFFLTAVISLQKTYQKNNRNYETSKDSWRLHDPQKSARY
jgi:cbb3-type cytochrome oxidase subunit 3